MHVLLDEILSKHISFLWGKGCGSGVDQSQGEMLVHTDARVAKGAGEQQGRDRG